MTNPYGITEFDATGAISALEAARSNRIRQMLLQRQLAQEERQLEQQRGMRAAIDRFTGGTGASAAAPKATETPTPAMDAVTSAATAPTSAPAAPSPAVPAAPAPTAPTGQGDFGRLTTELLAIDPEHAPQILQAFRTMNEEQFTAAQRRNAVLARAAYTLLALPPEQRSAEFQRIAPDLIQNGGVTRQQLAGFELTEANLHHIINQARDVEKLAEEARPRPITVTQGGSVIDANSIDPATGRPRVLYESPTVEVGGDVYTRPSGMSSIPQERTATNPRTGERVRLNPQTGQWEPVQGGPASPAPGNFP